MYNRLAAEIIQDSWGHSKKLEILRMLLERYKKSEYINPKCTEIMLNLLKICDFVQKIHHFFK